MAENGNGSAKKQIKNINVINMNKELQRKQNQYKTQKEKRAHLFEKVRHLNSNEEEDEDDDEDMIESKNNLTDIKEQLQEEIKENQAVEETLIDPKKETTTTKFGSSILNKMNSIKNTLKNIVSNSSNSKNKLTTATITSTTSNPTKTVTHTVEDTTRTKVKSFMNSTVSTKSKLNANARQQEHKENLSKALNNLDSKIITQQHKRLQDNVMMRSISASQIGLGNKKVIRKQESTASVSSKKNDLEKPLGFNLESTSSNNSTLHPANSTTLVNGKPGAKPVFRISKIKYDDRHLFDTVI
jgi:hypothetical protein